MLGEPIEPLSVYFGKEEKDPQLRKLSVFPKTKQERRLRLRAKLDALYFILYGIYDPENAASSREDIRYIYSTFPIVERQKIARWGSYRSRDLALAWINALMASQPDAEVA